MIYVRMSGRMGNQMFKYATARAMQLSMNSTEKIAVDFSGYPKDMGSYSKNYLEEFHCVDNIICKKYQFTLIQKICLLFFKIYMKVSGKNTNSKDDILEFQNKYADLFSKFGLYMYRSGYHKFNIPKKDKDIFFRGNSEAHEYFDCIRSQLLKEFIPINISDRNMEKYNDFLKEKAIIAICVRRGDFVDSRHKGKLDICTPEYYQKGIETIENKVSCKCKIIVFSDDVDYCKNCMNIEADEYIGDKITPWEQLYIMSACNYFIIGNSTYHWWAQYLSERKDKLVVAPAYWNHKKEKNDLYQKDWLLLDPEKLNVVFS